jgi:ribosomal protein L22
MTRKDYKAIASAIANAKKNEGLNAEQMANEIIFQIGQVLKNDNERFNIYTFAQACEATDI